MATTSDRSDTQPHRENPTLIAPFCDIAPGGDRVLSVVVTYNPDTPVDGLLRALRDTDVLVVDNASANPEAIAGSVEASGGTLIRNAENRGIAAALNQAAEKVLAEGYDWLATFDQDSRPPPGAVRSLLLALEAHPDRDRIGIAAMVRRDEGSGEDYQNRASVLVDQTAWRTVRTTITSGSLIRASTLRRAGLFREDFFIDAVDTEFCLRTRKANFDIVEFKTICMAHRIGEGTRKAVLGRSIAVSRHAPVRYYYYNRNLPETIRLYFLFDAIWGTRSILSLGAELFKLLSYESDRFIKIIYLSRGVADFVRGRFGPYRRRNSQKSHP